MRDVACDFGTCNTVLAAFNESTGRAETLEIPEFTLPMRYRLDGAAAEHVAWVTPSLVHFGPERTLIGNQVVSKSLIDHPDTFRWMKRGIAYGGKKKRTSQGHKSPEEAGKEFLIRLLQNASAQVSFTEDAFTFTAPVEAFENFQVWLWQITEELGIRRARLLDEPTAAIFGYHGAARKDERFLIVDFGGGTLDASAVRIDNEASDGRKAVQLGKAGVDIGGMNVDSWLLENFCRRHGLEGSDRRALESVILRKAEDVKMTLSDPKETEAELSVPVDRAGMVRVLRSEYTRDCPRCRSAQKHTALQDGGDCPDCLGCILAQQQFEHRVTETMDLALENAAVNAGTRRGDISRVLVTGGSSLIPAFRKLVEARFPGKVEYGQPFDCVARGACRPVVDLILQHDYAIKSYNKEMKAYEFRPLFKQGTEYPTPPSRPVRVWLKGTVEGATRVGLEIYEVSQIRYRDLSRSLVDAQGLLRDDRIASENHYIWLNSDPESRTYVVADPPYSAQRDARRFLAVFSIDANRRLLVTVTDALDGAKGPLLEAHPVARL